MGQTVVRELQAVQLLNQNILGQVIKPEPLTGGCLKLRITSMSEIRF